MAASGGCFDFSSRRLEGFQVELEPDEVVHLSVADNFLATLPDSLADLRALQTLDATSNLFRSIPVCVCYCDGLESLSFRDNRLAEVPEEIGLLTNLRHLILESSTTANNQIRTLPETFSNLTALQRLEIAHNKLQRLPDLSRMSLLLSLDLRNNSLTALPPLSPGHITFLDLSSNSIASFPSVVFPALTDLNLSDNGLKELPSEFGAMCPELIRWQASNNLFIELPPSMLTMTCLRSVAITSNGFEGFPEALLLPCLEELDLSDNPLTTISNVPLESLVSLRSLNLSYTPLGGLEGSPVPVAGLIALSALPVLGDLHISHDLPEATVVELCGNMPGVRVLREGSSPDYYSDDEEGEDEDYDGLAEMEVGMQSVSLNDHANRDDNEATETCVVCEDWGDLLICDRCDQNFHLACVGLSSIPFGDWYCPHCTNYKSQAL